MKSHSFYIQYTICLILIAISGLGIFHFYFFTKLSNSLSFYISAASSFLCIISFILVSYYANNFKIKKILSLIKNFSSTLLRIDNSIIDHEKMDSIITSNFLKYTQNVEKNTVELYSRSIPFFFTFFTIAVILAFLAVKSLYFLAYIVLILHIIIPFFIFIKQIISDNKFDFNIKQFCFTITKAVKGIQFFEATDKISFNFNQNLKKITSKEISNLEKSLWKTFKLLCLVFIIVCISYSIVDNQYTIEIILSVNKFIILIFAAILSYTLFLCSILKIKKNDISTDNCLENYIYKNQPVPIQKFNKKDFFIAFHRICFHDSAIITNKPIFKDLTFSILPKETISIIGENSSYIFDLLLKFYTAQSGNIYISGTNIKNIETKILRSYFAIFKIDFGIIPGTVKDNILLACDSIDNEKLFKIAENTGLLEVLNEEIYNQKGELIASYDILVRIQMARIFIRNNHYKVILIEFPKQFNNLEDKELFYNFVSFIIKNKTALIITELPQILTNSDKILFLKKNNTIFGTHSELIYDKDYLKFFNQ